MSEAQGREVRARDKNLEISTQVGVKTVKGYDLLCRAWREKKKR